MGYVAKNLMNEEQVIYEAKIHWLIFLPSILLFVIAVALARMPDADGLHMISVLVFFSSIYYLIKSFITRMSTELAITSKRVIAKTGLIRRHTVELNHSKVESFSVEQGILGRIFDFGTIVINGTGGGKTPIPSIDSPLEFRRNAMETIDARQA